MNAVTGVVMLLMIPNGMGGVEINMREFASMETCKRVQSALTFLNDKTAVAKPKPYRVFSDCVLLEDIELQISPVILDKDPGQ